LPGLIVVIAIHNWFFEFYRVKFKIMDLPFDIRQFLEVFKSYNQAIWPSQLVFLLLALIAVFIIIWKPMVSGKIIPIILALLWLWGGVYHLLFFPAINEAANIFGLLFILQGILFLRYGLLASQVFELKKDVYGITAATLIAYALVAYPVIGLYAEHTYVYAPTFVLPCPTTIFTFGILVLSRRRLPLYMLLIPFAWAITGFAAALKLSIYEDTGVIISAILLSISNLIKHKNNSDFYQYAKLLEEIKKLKIKIPVS